MEATWTSHRGGKFRFRSFATRGLPVDVRFHLGTDRFPATLTAPGRRGRLMEYAGIELDIPTVARYRTSDDGDWLVKAALWNPVKGDSGGVGLIAYREGQEGAFEGNGRELIFGEEYYGIFEYDGKAFTLLREPRR